MKKPYIRPESRLFAINLAENIAASGGYVVPGGAGINQGPGYLYYSNYIDAIVEVSEGSPEWMFTDEMLTKYYRDPLNRWPDIMNNCYGKVL